MRSRFVIAPALIAYAACAACAAPPSAPAACGQPAPLGDPSQIKTPVGASNGPRIDAPKLCKGASASSTGAYIRVYGAGVRRIAMGQAPIDAGCAVAPPIGSGPEVCPEVSADGFGKAVIERLKALGVEINGLGVGVCGDSSGDDYDAWNVSIGVIDYGDADAAIQAVDAELRRWNVGHFFGVSVRGIDCATPL